MMPWRTQQSTTANQRAAPPGDRGDLTSVDLYNSKICKGLKLQDRARETRFSNTECGQSHGELRRDWNEDCHDSNTEKDDVLLLP